MNNWYVITGAQGSGKSTTIEALEKLGYTTVPEAARVIIDEANAVGVSTSELRKNEQAFQEVVMKRKIATETNLSSDETVFLDRGMQDTLAYMRAYDFPVAAWIEDIFQESNYKKVFILEPLDNYEKDYARIEDIAFVQKLHHLLIDAFKQYGMQPISVPRGSVEDRVNFIMQAIKEE